MNLPIGSIINAAAVIAGGSIGLLLHQRFPKKIQETMFQGLGLATMLIGLQMAFKADDILAVVFSLVIGGVAGSILDLELKLSQFGDALKKKVHSNDSKFTDGFVTSSLLFCVGAMAIIGSINEGLFGDRSILLTKSLLDGATAVAFASTYGVGVLFSALPIIIYQGGITLVAGGAQSFFTPHIINQLSAVGGLLIVGISLNILEIKKVQVLNLLPAIVAAVLLAVLF
jgi:uncharacterized protein